MSWVHGPPVGRRDDVEAVGAARVGAVGVDADLEVGGAAVVEPVAGAAALVDARAPAVLAVAVPGQPDHGAERPQPLAQPQGDVPGEAGLGVAAVGGRAGGVARLAEAAGRHQPVDPAREVVVAELVTRVDDHDPARQ